MSNLIKISDKQYENIIKCTVFTMAELADKDKKFNFFRELDDYCDFIFKKEKRITLTEFSKIVNEVMDKIPKDWSWLPAKEPVKLKLFNKKEGEFFNKPLCFYCFTFGHKKVALNLNLEKCPFCNQWIDWSNWY